MFFFKKTPDALSTELLEAVVENSLEKIKTLLTPDADGMSASLHTYWIKKDNKSPLMLAASLGFLDIVKLFIRYLPNKTDLDYRQIKLNKTALHYAAAAGHLDIVQCLVEAGASLHIEDTDRMTPLIAAAIAGKESVVAYLVKLPNYSHETRQPEKNTALLFAAVADQPGVIVILANANADIDNINHSSRDTPLTLAGSSGKEKAVRCLVTLGANINHRNIHNDTVLHWAMKKHPRLIPFLLQHGADQTLKTGSGSMPLDLASPETKKILTQYHETNAKLLQIAKKPGDDAAALEALPNIEYDVNIADEAKETPIIHACRAGNIKIVKFLVGKNAKTTGEAQYLLFRALESGSLDLLRYLIEELKLPTNTLTPNNLNLLYFAIKCNALSAISYLADEKGFNVNHIDPAHLPVLLFTAQYGTPEMMRKIAPLLTASDTLDNQGNTVFHHAALNKQHNVLPALFEANIHQHASIDALNNEEATPLMMAAKTGNTGAAHSLLCAGADITCVENISGKNALMIAIDGNHKDIIKMLVYKYLKRTSPYDLNTLCYLLSAAKITKSDICKHILMLSQEAGNHQQTDLQINLLSEAITPGDTLLSQYMQIPESNPTEDPIGMLKLELHKIYASKPYQSTQTTHLYPLAPSSVAYAPPPLVLSPTKPTEPAPTSTTYMQTTMVPPEYTPILSPSAPALEVTQEEAEHAAQTLWLYLSQQQQRLEEIKQGVSRLFPGKL